MRSGFVKYLRGPIITFFEQTQLMTVLFYFILLHCIKSNVKMTRRLLDSAIYSIEMGT